MISIFYIGYFIAQYPTNLLMQRFPTGKYITINFVLWGTASSSCFTFAFINLHQVSRSHVVLVLRILLPLPQLVSSLVSSSRVSTQASS